MNDRNSVVASRQAPLMTTYRQRPERALSFKCARTTQHPNTDPFHGSVALDGYPQVRWDYGIDSKVGGFDDLPNPGHLLCAALAGCMDSTIRMLADRVGARIEELEVEVSGDVDVRGCLAVDRSVRMGFRQLHCHVRLELDPAAPPRAAEILIRQAENLCVTLDTLRHGTSITVAGHASHPQTSQFRGLTTHTATNHTE